MQALARASLTWEEGCATRRITRVVGPRGALSFGRVTISIILGGGMIMPPTMAIKVVEFSNGGYKIRKIFA